MAASVQRLDQSPEGKIDLHLHPSKDTFLAFFAFLRVVKSMTKVDIVDGAILQDPRSLGKLHSNLNLIKHTMGEREWLKRSPRYMFSGINFLNGPNPAPFVIFALFTTQRQIMAQI